MFYNLVAAVVFAGLYGEAAYARTPGSAGLVALVTFIVVFAALALPSRLFKYTNADIAPVVLTQLMQRGAVGSTLIVLNTLVTGFIIGRLADPVLIGELFLFTIVGVFLFQGFGAVITRHVIYLQQTHQYNSNQLAAILLMVTLLIFVLVLYFLSFDLGRPPELHAYLRDLIAITLILLGYGRAVYLMAHH
ncbi:MAG: hypothetical protein WCF84_00725 [Anaerolineae bacterium]